MQKYPRSTVVDILSFIASGTREISKRSFEELGSEKRVRKTTEDL
jgi:hypothetical protein